MRQRHGNILKGIRGLFVAVLVAGLCISVSAYGEEPDADSEQQPEQVDDDRDPVDGPEVPDDEFMEGEEEEDADEDDESLLPTADIEAPRDADPEFEEHLEGYRAAYERYSEAIEDYQRELQHLVETEFERRMAEIDEAFDPRIREAQVVERHRRGEAIESLEEFIAEYPGDPEFTPDALAQLGVLYDQREQDEYEQAQEEYFEHRQQNPDEHIDAPLRSYDDSREVFEELIGQWPDYPGIDLAYYYMTHMEWDLHNWEEAREMAGELIRQRPDSEFVPHAWLIVGEYYFDQADKDGPEHIRDNLQLALEAFEEAGSEAGRQYLSDDNYVRVVYSWAWSHYRLENYPEAIGVFRDAVELIDELAELTGVGRELLREDALAHLADILAMEDWELDGVADERDTVQRRVEQYLSEGDDYEREVLVLLGEQLLEFLREDEAIWVFQRVLDLHPLHPENPEVHAQIIAALHRDYREEEAFAVRREMIDYYGEGSSWHEHQQRMGNEGAIREAENLVRDYLLMAATWYHEQAQTQRNEAMVSQDPALLALTEEKYALAADAYEEFIRNYPNDREIFQWTFYYAETLYYAGDYEAALEQYQVVRELDIADNPFQEVSAFNAVQALEFLMREEVEAGNLTPVALGGADMEEAREAADSVEQERDIDEDEILEQADVEGMPVPSMVEDYVTAMDRYVVLGLENEDDDYLDAKLAFQAAKVFHDFRHFDESRERFAWVVENYSEHEVAYLAGSLILESFRQENDFQSLTEWAEKLEGVITGEQAEAVRAEVREYRLVGMFQAGEQALEEDDPRAAAEQFAQLAREDPDHELAPRSLNNAASVYEMIGDYDKAIEHYEELFRDYPDHPLSTRAVYRVAVNSEWLFDYDRSLRHYQLFYEEFEGPTPEVLEELDFDIEQRRQEALLYTAQISEYLQRYDDAARTFEDYFGQYPEADEAAETLWAASEMWEKAGRTDDKLRVLEEYIDEYGDQHDHGQRLIEARAKMAEVHERRGRRGATDRERERIVETVDEWIEEGDLPEGDAAIRAHAAESRFMLVERELEEWEQITIEGTLQQQERRLEEKVEGTEELIDKYEEVFEYGNLDWNLAANFRMGDLLHQMAEALFDVPIPFEEGTEEYWVYQDTLDSIAFPLEDRAVERYEETIERARENEIVNEWTERTLQALQEYAPAEYPYFEDERRPRRDTIDLGIPLLSQEEYERRMERRETELDEQLDAVDTDVGGGGEDS